MIRILRAFAWMRWRVLVNSFDRTGTRDVVERFSLAMDQVAPILALVLFVPSALMLAGLGGAAGYSIRHGEESVLLEAVRFLLLGALVLALVGPLLLPAAGRTNIVRLMLLPIPRGTLYVAQAAGATTDPWNLLSIPLLLGIPAGLVIGGRPVAAAVALAAGLLLILVLVGLSTAATVLLQLLFRDRRRGELAALLFILVIPVASMLPGLLEVSEHRAQRRAGPAASAAEAEQTSGWLQRAAVAFRFVPSQLHAGAVRDASAHATADSLRQIVPLAGAALALHGIAFLVFRRLLESPSATGGRRQAASRSSSSRILPGTTPAVSVVAMTQLRLALRTPRGRSIVLSPLLVFVVLGLMIRQSGGEPGFDFPLLNNGLGLGAFGASVGLLSILPFAMNQFAIDGAGLTLVLLSPLRDEDYLKGKAIGNGLIAAGPGLLSILAAFLLFPGAGHLALWVSLPLGMLSAYLLLAPAAAALSTLLPRAVDLNSIGRGSNAHGLAGFVGLFATLAAIAPAALLAVVVHRLAGPSVVPLAMGLWCVVSLALSALLFRAVRPLFHRRRENLGLVV